MYGFSLELSIAVSSPNVEIISSLQIGRSVVYSTHLEGHPRKFSLGIPAFISNVSVTKSWLLLGETQRFYD